MVLKIIDKKAILMCASAALKKLTAWLHWMRAASSANIIAIVSRWQKRMTR